MASPFLPFVGPILDLLRQWIPDANQRAKAEEQLLQSAQDGALALAVQQIKVNAEEAKHSSIFVAGWRPAVGWTCVFGLAYTFVLRPFLAWLSLMFDIPVPPTLDISDLLVLLSGMLGLSGMRSYEKARGVARNGLPPKPAKPVQDPAEDTYVG